MLFRSIAYGVMLLVLLLWALYRVGYKRLFRGRRKPVVQVEPATTASSEGEQLFFRASQYLEQGDPLLFYQELQRSLLLWIGEHTGWTASSWDKKNLRQWLEERNTEGDVVERWVRLLDGLESELYSGGAVDGSAMRHYWMEAQILVKSMDEMAGRWNDQSQNR